MRQITCACGRLDALARKVAARGSLIIIRFDMDGVVCDFDRGRNAALPGCPDLNRPSSEYTETDRAWRARLDEHLRQKPDFYFHLQPFADVCRLFRELEPLLPRVLTAIPEVFPTGSPEYLAAEDAKWRWCPKYLNLTDPSRFDCTRSSLKHTYVRRDAIDVLIDDRISNCAEWSAAGGSAILHRSAAETRAALRKLLTLAAA